MRRISTARILSTARIAIFVLFALVGLPGGPGQPAGGQQPDTAGQQPGESHGGREPAPSDSDHASVESQEAIREILQLRRRHGTVLAGTLLDPASAPGSDARDSSQVFEQALRQVAVRAQDRTPTTVPTAADSLSAPPRLAAFPAAAGEDPLVADLRDTSRRLDERAAALEPLGYYDQADQLRRLARRLRQAARAAVSTERLSPIAHPSAEGPGPD
ncbi:MAG: hypothetical protein J5I93_15620 [Pirellulaceae bacterium]|nr:hypothetical protein [Pirellulaceae bacterium]